MERISLKKPNKRRKRIVIGSIFLIIVVFSLIFFSKSVSNTSFRVSRPLQAALWSAGDSAFDWAHSFLRQGDLAKEKIRLLEEKERLTEEVVRLRGLREENNILREALNLGIDKDFEVIMANVSGKDILDDIIVIDRGSNDGISEGMSVITEKRIALGRVIEVYENFSRVMLITHEDSIFDAEIRGKSTMGLVKGIGNSRAKMTLIPKETDIEEGDSLVTVPLGGVFPQGLFVGLVKSIERNDADHFQEADIAPFFSVRRLKKVFVITDERR